MASWSNMPGGKMSLPHMEEDFSKDSQSAAEDNGRGTPRPDLPLTYAEMAFQRTLNSPSQWP